jgi:hypothetical protein
MERMQSKVEGRDDLSTIAARVTTIFRPEEGEWKVVHRHADPITTASRVGHTGVDLPLERPFENRAGEVQDSVKVCIGPIR